MTLQSVSIVNLQSNNNPVPSITNLNPSSATAGSPTFSLTVNGANFVSNSAVYWNGAALSTTFINSTQLTAIVPSSTLTSAGTVSVTVFNPTPGGGPSAGPQTFTLENPIPVISSLFPVTRATGTQAFMLSVSGSSFAPGASVRWNGSDLDTIYVSSALLAATVPAEDLTTPGTAAITVFNPQPGGGPSAAGQLSFTLTSIDPAYGATVLTLRSSIDWPDVDNATSYNLQASTRSTLSSPFLNKTIGVSTYTPTSDIPGNCPVYWRVRALVNQVWGAWSETRMFFSPNPPKAPTLRTPANGALTTSYLPRLDWSNSSLPAGATFDHYDLQLASDAAFTSGLMEQNIDGQATNSEYTLSTALTPNTRYYWRVRAFNTARQSSNWSSVYYLRAAMLPTSLTSPANVTSPTMTTFRPTFSWNPVTGASSYTIRISSTSAFSSTVVNSKASGTSYVPTIDLPLNKVLYWRVRAEGANGPSLWSAVWTFTSANPPSTPKLSSPSANGLVTSYTPTLYWKASTLPVGVTLANYQIQVTTDATFATTLTDQKPQANYLVSSPSLSPNTKYYWRVRAYGSNGHYSSWSSTSYFRAAMLPPALLTLGNGDTISSVRPLFDWGDVDGASTYTIQVSTYSTFNSLNINKTANSSSYTPTSNLPAGHLLYWRVRANGSNGPSLWSGTVSFNTP
jgi:hypothetical protein